MTGFGTTIGPFRVTEKNDRIRFCVFHLTTAIHGFGIQRNYFARNVRATNSPAFVYSRCANGSPPILSVSRPCSKNPNCDSYPIFG